MFPLNSDLEIWCTYYAMPITEKYLYLIFDTHHQKFNGVDLQKNPINFFSELITLDIKTFSFEKLRESDITCPIDWVSFKRIVKGKRTCCRHQS